MSNPTAEIGQLSESMANLGTSKRKSNEDKPPKRKKNNNNQNNRPRPSANNAQQHVQKQRDKLNVITQQNIKDTYDQVSMSVHKYVFSEQLTCPGRLFSFETPKLREIIDHLSQTIHDLPGFRSKLPNLELPQVQASLKVAINDFVIMKLYLARKNMALETDESNSKLSSLWRNLETIIRHSMEDGIAFPLPLMDLLNMIGNFSIYGRPVSYYPEPRYTDTDANFMLTAPKVQIFTSYPHDERVFSWRVPAARVDDAYAVLPFYAEYGGIARINHLESYYDENGAVNAACVHLGNEQLIASRAVYMHVSYMPRVDAYRNIRSICRQLSSINVAKVVYGEVSGKGTPAQLSCVRGDEFKSEYADIEGHDLIMGAYMFDATLPYPHEKVNASLKARCAKMGFGLFLSKLDGKMQSMD